MFLFLERDPKAGITTQSYRSATPFQNRSSEAKLRDYNAELPLCGSIFHQIKKSGSHIGIPDQIRCIWRVILLI